MTRNRPDCLRRFLPRALLILAALASSLTSLPGRVPGDTKLYLYLNPQRLISDSIWSWDMRQFGGWVPHQNVGYLWPTGPFFALFDALSLPDWIAHRLWITTLLSLAGVGAYSFAKYLGMSAGGALLAAATYQFSPYVLPYVSRTSALLLPWSLLPWLVLLANRFASRRRLSDLALFTLLIASSGGLNATALLVLIPGPLIWALHRDGRTRTTLRRRATPVVLLGTASLLASTWWLVGLYIQGRYGAAVLSYSEALVSTAATSTAPEVLRGLGYWLFYDRGPAAALTTASWPYQTSLVLIVVSAFVVVLGLYGISCSSKYRRPLATMLFTGLVIAVGAHPFSNPSPAFRFFGDHPRQALSLALRSSTRAVPLVVLALSIGVGFAWHLVLGRKSTLETWARGWTSKLLANRTLRYVLLLGIVIGQLPAASNGDLVDRSVARPESLPPSWTRAAEYLDDRYDQGYTGAVLLVPGIESAAYRWGYPVDPILPGISRKPFLSRDWLPLGSPAMMDLLYALDDSFQNGTPDMDAVAPVARMLGADTVMFVTSHQYERFGTIRPSRVVDLFDPAPAGLDLLATFGNPTENRSSLERWSEEIVAHPDRDLPEIFLFSVERSGQPSRILQDPWIYAGDGTGLVDLASTTDLEGDEFALSESSLNDDRLAEFETRARLTILSDSNRKRAHHWRSSQDVWGATETIDGVVDVRDDFDSRLPIDPTSTLDSRTIVESGPVRATATAYGAALTYNPEFRPSAAVDGDLDTAWRIGQDRDPRGQVLTVTSNSSLDGLRLVQPLDRGRTTWITEISLRVDDGDWVPLPLDESSRSPQGQSVPLPNRSTKIEIRLDAIDGWDRLATSLGVGFAEILDASNVSPEIIRLPTRIDGIEGVPLLYSINRLRVDPFDRWRKDPEPAMIRRLPVAIDDVQRFDMEVRLSSVAPDAVLAEQLGATGGISDERLHGTASWWGPAAFDGDASTAWWGPVSTDTDSNGYGSLTVPLVQPMNWMEFQYAEGSRSSRPSRIRVDFRNGEEIVFSEEMTVPPPDSRRRSKIFIRNAVAESATITILAVDGTQVVDAFTGSEIPAPVAVSEVRSDAWRNEPFPSTFDTGCRTDLIFIDDEPISVRLTGSTARALDGDPVRAETCSTEPTRISKNSLLVSTKGSLSGWSIDRIRISDLPANPTRRPAASISATMGRSSLVATTPGCPSVCAIEAPFGYSRGWEASLNGKDLGSPIRTAAGRSAWLVEDSPDGSRLEANWFPQDWMWIGLSISGLTTLIALIVLFVTSRRRHRNSCECPNSSPSIDTVDPSNTNWLRAPFACFILGSLFISPLWGLLSTTLFVLLRRRQSWNLLFGFVLLGYAFVLLQQVRTGAEPGFSWPSVFERAHRPMLATLLVFTMWMFESKDRPYAGPNRG